MSRLLPRTRGPVSAAPCPCCGHLMDLRTLLKTHPLATGMEISCDHCQDVGVVAAINTYFDEAGHLVDEVSLRPKKG